MTNKSRTLQATLLEYREASDTGDIESGATKIEMAASLQSFIETSVHKFLAGQREHGGRLQDRNMDQEISNELIDLFWYSSAKNWKK